MNCAGGHVFTYSAREGTGAARMKGQVRSDVRKRRNRVLTEELEESANFYRMKFIGRKASVLWESVSAMGEQGWQMEGWTENYLRARAFAPEPRWNRIESLVLTNVDGSVVCGDLHLSG
jgi:threonylcarbamoyladenosine tRNA methylthiotransferase MtaB